MDHRRRSATHGAGSLANGFVTGYFANMVFDKPDWRIDGQNVSDDLAAAEKKTGGSGRLD